MQPAGKKQNSKTTILNPVDLHSTMNQILVIVKYLLLVAGHEIPELNSAVRVEITGKIS